MLVNDWMNSPVITVDVSDTMHKAVNLMHEHNIGMLPVLENGKLVGIVTDRDLKRSAPSDVVLFDIKDIVYHLARVHVGAIMTPNPIALRPDHTIEEAAQTLREHNISGCPVLDGEDQIAGIITKNDIFNALTSACGIINKGIQFGLLVEDRPGSIKEVTDVIRNYKARLVSILTTYDKAPDGYRCLYIRVFQVNREKLPQLKEELAKTARLLYMVDLRDGNRETYASY